MSVKSLPKLPKQKTLDSWKDKSKWLTIENGYLFCKWCTKYEQRISSLKGSVRNSLMDKIISNHLESKSMRRTAKLQKRYKEKDEAKERGETYRVDIPTDASIAQSFKRMRQTESEGLHKLFDVAHYVAIKGRSDFELEKLHGVSFHGSGYENRNACRDFLLNFRLFVSNGRQRKSATC